MPTREIPRSEWREFFDSFSTEHEGWLTSIEITGSDIGGDQIEAGELPFQGISADTKGSEPDAIEIMCGRNPSDELTHIVHDASLVFFDQGEAGAHQAVEIESADGSKTILRFRAASEPTDLKNVRKTGQTRRAGGR